MVAQPAPEPGKTVSVGLGARLTLITAAAAVVLAVLAWREGGFIALWLTPDQQGQRAYDALRFSDAADLFEDPLRAGAAAYDAGRYEDAAAAFGRVPSAQALYNRGNAQMRSFDYSQAIASYELAAAEAPDWPEARDNLALARHVLAYIERSREQSDTGDETELGADDYRFDNTRKRGLDIVVTEQSTLEAASAQKWMRSVNTETRDFLRTRFALEADREAAP